MATSGTRTFDLDIAEAIEEAFERIGQSPRSGYDLETARRSLNLMFMDWANRGVNLWTVERGAITLTAGQGQETLDASTSDLLDVVIRRDNTDYIIERLGRSEWANIPTKSTQGRPSQFWYDRQTTPVINLWPVPENSTDQLLYWYVRRIEDAGAMQNTAAVPWRFLPCLVSGLAYHLGMKRAPQMLPTLQAMYEQDFQRAADEDEERVPLRLVPGRR